MAPHCRADPMLLSADHAIPLGLLINEFVTNAVKIRLLGRWWCDRGLSPGSRRTPPHRSFRPGHRPSGRLCHRSAPRQPGLRGDIGHGPPASRPAYDCVQPSERRALSDRTADSSQTGNTSVVRAFLQIPFPKSIGARPPRRHVHSLIANKPRRPWKTTRPSLGRSPVRAATASAPSHV